MLTATPSRTRWPVVLAASVAAHALLLGLPWLQSTSGEGEAAPLMVTLLPTVTVAAAPAVPPRVNNVARTRLVTQNVQSPTPAPPALITEAEPVATNRTSAIASLADNSHAAEPELSAQSNAPPAPIQQHTTLAAPDTGIVLARIRDTIARQRYPEMARQRGWEGKVQLGFRVEGSGVIDNIRVMHSSGNRLLDESAMHALQRIRYIPAELWRDGYSAELLLPVIYRLNES